jgi:putative glutamine amidotransferase
MKIGIIPKIIETHKNQFEASIELKLISFINKVFINCSTEILVSKKKSNFDILIISGGNDLPAAINDRKNQIRNNLNNYYYNYAKKNNIPVIAICLGALFIAKKMRCKIIKKKHVGSHSIYYNKKKILVNSFHNYIIDKFNSRIVPIAFAEDGSLECFKVAKNKIIGIMWHPERNKNIKKFDIEILKKYICN